MRRTITVALLGLLTGCAATVSCPTVDGDSRPVFLLDHGTHASLVISVGNGAAHRYSYGDRRWYAERDTGIGPGFRALFRETPAVLMRRRLDTSPTLDAVLASVREPVRNAYRFEAPVERIDALVTRLDGIYRAGAGDPGPEYAPHPVPYTMGNNSNHVVAVWLTELGCQTRGSPMISNWRAN